MAEKKVARAEKAAEKLAEMTQAYLANLSPSERRAKLSAFRQVVAGIGGRRAKSSGAFRTPSTPLAARGHGGR